MENASKALIMAASILLGLMIVSVGTVLFNSFGGFSKNITEEIAKKQIAEFNAQFQKYEGKKITTHDIVTLANLAQKNNKEYELEEKQKSNKEEENTNYVQIQLSGEGSDPKNKNLEGWDENKLTRFIENNNMIKKDDNTLEVKYYYISQIVVSPLTGRVTYVEIKPI